MKRVNQKGLASRTTAWILSAASFILSVQLLFPFIMLVFNALAFFAARRTEAAILAKASGFRLRD